MDIAPWKRQYLTGKCFDFALALAEQVKTPTFVAVGNPRFPDHVGLKMDDLYADVRGILSEQDFLAHHSPSPIVPVQRADIEFHCGLSGVKPPYRGNADIAQARKAVTAVFPEGVVAAVAARQAENSEPALPTP